MSTDKLERSVRVGDRNTLGASTIGSDLTITGNVTSKGEINLDGHVRGDIRCATLVLGEDSSIEGNVEAEDVLVRGHLIGSVKALRVMLQSTAHVEGDLSHQNGLSIEQGAFFDGKSLPLENPLSSSQTHAEDSTASEPPPVIAGQHKEKTAFVRSLPEAN